MIKPLAKELDDLGGGACDVWGRQFGVFCTLGTNALVGYVLHGIVGDTVGAFLLEDAPAWYVTTGFVLYFGVTYLFLRSLEKRTIFEKIWAIAGYRVFQ